ncbi:MAG: winged helix DNA-binding domain-containing protein [Thermomicrobiales bacterium]
MPNQTLPTLSTRALNRATLARQHLLTPSTLGTAEMVAHLNGIQTQVPQAPYLALWSRLAAFDPETLSAGLLDRSFIRIVTMRGTVHLHTAADALTMRAITQDAIARRLRTTPDYRQMATRLDPDDLLTWGRAEVERTPGTLASLRPALAARWPDADPVVMARALNYILPMVQVPPRGLWGKTGQPVLTTLEAWTGSALPAEPDLDDIVLRYIAAYGPVSVLDAQVWSGVTRLGAVFARLRDRLVVFRNEGGRELYDLPDAPRPEEDVPAPVRILAPFDNILISYKDRQRIMPPGHQPLIFTVNGLVSPTVLVDGFSAGIATIARSTSAATLKVNLFHAVPAGGREEIEAEGLRLLAFAEPDARTTAVAFTGPA